MTDTPSPLVTLADQTYLVGDSVYLRPAVPADAEVASAWRGSVFPMAPDRVREWIESDLSRRMQPYAKATYLIVRRRDERVVGSLVTDITEFPHAAVTIAMEPLQGEVARPWKAEALELAFRLIVEEQQLPKAAVSLPASERDVIDALVRLGAREVARFREKLARPGGGRDDEVVVEFLNASWLARLGDPAEREIPRSGTGVPRPVIAPVMPEGDPPANAMRVGPRVYLRAPAKADAPRMASLFLRETDASWENGRKPKSTQAIEQWIDSWQATTPPKTIDLVACDRETDELIGLMGLLGVNWRHRYGESASMIMQPAYREAGYGSEAKHLLFDYLFNELDLHAIQSWVQFENPRSAAALRKQGYREAGREHWIEMRDGGFTSFAAFDLLADDWRAMPRATGS